MTKTKRTFIDSTKRVERLLKKYPKVHLVVPIPKLLTFKGRMNSFFLFRVNLAKLHSKENLTIAKLSSIASEKWKRLGDDQKFWKEVAKLAALENQKRRLIQKLTGLEVTPTKFFPNAFVNNSIILHLLGRTCDK